MTFDPETIDGMRLAFVGDDIAQSDATAVGSWLDRVTGTIAPSGTTTQRPTYRTASAINSQPAVDFDGAANRLRYAGSVSSALVGWSFAVVRFDSFATTNKVVWSSAAEADTTHILQGQASTAAQLRISQVNADTTDTIRGGTTLTTGTTYLLEWMSDGAAYTLRVNGSAETLTVVGGSNLGDWLGDTTGRVNFVLGALIRTTESNFLDGLMACMGLADGVPPDVQINRLYGQLNTKYGLSLPFTTPGPPLTRPPRPRINLVRS